MNKCCNFFKNMKIVEKVKIWLIAVLVLVVAGSVVWGIFGLNTDGSFKGYNKVTVTATTSINIEEIKNDTQDWFAENGVKVVSLKTVSETTLMYEVKTSMKETEVETGLESVLKSKTYGSQLAKETPVDFQEASASVNSAPALWAFLAIGIAWVVAFVYLLIRYKWRKALSAVLGMLVAMYLTICLTAITRIPVGVNYISAVAFTFVFSAILSVLYANKLKTVLNSASNKNFTASQIANTAVGETFVLNMVFAVASIIVLVAGIIFAATPVKYLLLACVVGVIASVFAVTVASSTIYAYLGKEEPTVKSVTAEKTEA